MKELDDLRAYLTARAKECATQIERYGEAGAFEDAVSLREVSAIQALLADQPPRTSAERIPADIMEAIVVYRDRGLHPGQCLQALLGNDLLTTIRFGDDRVIHALPAILAWLSDGRNMPAEAWGTIMKVGAWMRRPRS